MRVPPQTSPGELRHSHTLRCFSPEREGRKAGTAPSCLRCFYHLQLGPFGWVTPAMPAQSTPCQSGLRREDADLCFAECLWHSWAVGGLSANPSAPVRVPAAGAAGPAREWPLSRAVMLYAELFSLGQDYRNDLGS